LNKGDKKIISVSLFSYLPLSAPNIMTDKTVLTGALLGFTLAETTIMAAAWYHSRSADVSNVFTLQPIQKQLLT
jgi:hypothetical protein